MTIYDIAKKLKVSPATVSMALSGDPKVAEKTRLRVQSFAAKNGFTPSESARNFRLKRSSLVAVVVYDIASDFWAGVVRTIEAELGSAYSVILCNSYGSLENERLILQTLAQRQIAGLVIVPASATEQRHLVELNESGVPVVLFERTIDESSLSFVKGDDYKAAYDAVCFCVKGGHSRIAMISFKTKILGVQDRLDAFAAACRDAGISSSCETFVLDELSERSVTELFVPRARDFSVALSIEDSLGAILLCALRKSGVAVPQELSIISWNNSSYLDFLNPRLTSISVPVKEMGVQAARIVLGRRISGLAEPKRIFLEESLVLRDSFVEI